MGETEIDFKDTCWVYFIFFFTHLWCTQENCENEGWKKRFGRVGKHKRKTNQQAHFKKSFYFDKIMDGTGSNNFDKRVQQ